VELVEGDAFIGKARQGRDVDLSPKRVGQAKADVVKQNDEDIRRVGGKVVRLRAPHMFRFLQCRAGCARGKNRLKCQNRAQCAVYLLSGSRSRLLARDYCCADAGANAVDDLHEPAPCDAIRLSLIRSFTKFHRLPPELWKRL
jgi:hypothetical protein